MNVDINQGCFVFHQILLMEAGQESREGPAQATKASDETASSESRHELLKKLEELENITSKVKCCVTLFDHNVCSFALVVWLNRRV